jgi:hypothetical protein
MTLECVLFDKNNKEIDWYDPIDDESDVIENNGILQIKHGNGHNYYIPKNKYNHFVVREMKEFK